MSTGDTQFVCLVPHLLLIRFKSCRTIANLLQNINKNQSEIGPPLIKLWLLGVLAF